MDLFAGSNERSRSTCTQDKKGCLLILILIAPFFTVNLVNLSVLFHEQIYIYIYTHTRTHTHTHIQTNTIYIYVCVYIYIDI